MAMWEPWHGCHRVSEGCRYCYIHRGDSKRGVDTNEVGRNPGLTRPIAKNKRGEYVMKPGQLVYTCFRSDFLLEDADPWRDECWAIMRERQDLQFLFLTKRIERFQVCMPEDWCEGWENVTVGCTVENQETADRRLAVFRDLPIAHKNIICQPMLGPIDLTRYLDGIELVVLGGEAGRDARPLDSDWVRDVRALCDMRHVPFQFRQRGTHYIDREKTDG